MKIKAALCREFGRALTIETVELASPSHREVMVDIRACAIGQADLSHTDGAWDGRLPAIYGHEAAGVVSATGPGVQSAGLGDHVIVTPIRACGHCHYCVRHSPVLCEEVFALDQESPLKLNDGTVCGQGLKTGAFAEKVLVHESQIERIPQDMPFDAAALLAGCVITGFGAVANTARVAPGHAVAVVGCGGVGLNSIQGAALAGASPVIAIDPFEEKRLAAEAFGATHCFSPAEPKHIRETIRLTAGRGVDFVFVTAGTPQALEDAPRYISRNGAIIIVGMPPKGSSIAYDPVRLAAMNQKIIGSRLGEARITHDIPLLIEHHRKGRLKLDELITARYRLEDINEAMAAANSGKALRNVILFD
ncbi:formaldehyde dehydrogenase [Nitratireductor indicus C115]|uniref:Formaldehyde dehydrogenase n=1 Tax=Nitratireductor indicus C115 TaxID=1231190 RepID=K2PR80_9HYPH|nr:zinc-binding dehydrogenase [Nitratireductor indicus]EKF43542.1 formaldehyde dehydrogenase [Nitratireductor indicus C115]SFQ05340.1 Zn-dependent alcohol dehydrogenase [Nitratireductor indicus]